MGIVLSKSRQKAKKQVDIKCDEKASVKMESTFVDKAPTSTAVPKRSYGGDAIDSKNNHVLGKPIPGQSYVVRHQRTGLMLAVNEKSELATVPFDNITPENAVTGNTLEKSFSDADPGVRSDTLIPNYSI